MNIYPGGNVKRCGLCATNKCMEGSGVCVMCWQDLKAEMGRGTRRRCPCGGGALHYLCQRQAS